MTEINKNQIERDVKQSLIEDVGTGDITAALIDQDASAHATVIPREQAIICGQPWFNEVFNQLDHSIKIKWHVREGERVTPNQTLVSLQGNARALLTGERTALNWLQLLSGIATTVNSFSTLVKHTQAKLLDTRKTIPLLRHAQKYAVTVGGGHNHRFGLYDSYLIKENHIASCGSIEQAIFKARQLHPAKTIEIEVENLDQLAQAIQSKADIVMLDNFNLGDIKKAVVLNNGAVALEVSGNVSLSNIVSIAETGIDRISIGAFTKNIKAIDLSLRFAASQ